MKKKDKISPEWTKILQDTWDVFYAQQKTTLMVMRLFSIKGSCTMYKFKRQFMNQDSLTFNGPGYEKES